MEPGDHDFLDFMMGGGDELLNSYQCLHCGKWFHIDEGDAVEGKQNIVKCPGCDKEVDISK